MSTGAVRADWTRRLRRRQSRLRVRDNPSRRARTGWLRGEQRVIGHRRPSPHHDRVHASPQLLHDATRAFIADPATVARAAGDLAVECHGPLRDDPRTSVLNEHPVGRIQLVRCLLQHSDIDL